MRAENLGKGVPQFVGDLQKERAGEAVFQIGGDKTRDMGEVVPDRALQQKAMQRVERGLREESVDEDRALRSELCGEHGPVRVRVDGAGGDLGSLAQVDRSVVVVAEHLELGLGQWHWLVGELLRNRVVVARQQFKAKTLVRVLREIEKLLGIVFEFLPRRRSQRFQRHCRAVVAAAELIGAGEMVERPAALALRQPQKAQDAVGLIVLRFELRGPAESFDRLLYIAKAEQRDSAVVMRRDVGRIG